MLQSLCVSINSIDTILKQVEKSGVYHLQAYCDNMEYFYNQITITNHEPNPEDYKKKATYFDQYWRKTAFETIWNHPPPFQNPLLIKNKRGVYHKGQDKTSK